jgi:hypothetical protein
LRLAWAILFRKKLDFGEFSRSLAQRMTPLVQVRGRENMPVSEPCLLTINHFSHPGFQAWWMAVAISAELTLPVHWIMSAAWTTPNPWMSWWWTPMTSWFFQRLAEVFDFTTMPPMPPDPRHTAWRANSVRSVIRFIRDYQRQPGKAPLVIGLAPEGRDMPGGLIGMPPNGVGRFIQQMVELGLAVCPVGVFLEETGLCINFGAQYDPEKPPDLSRKEVDENIRRQVMQHIAELTPFELRGEFAQRLDPVENYH